MDTHYTNPKLAALYDESNHWSVDNDFYLSLADGGCFNILDVGCGTGLMCNRYASLGHKVTGIDPAASMLHVASQKPCSGQIEWQQSTAQTYSSNKRYDLIIMTGHAFQALLTDIEIEGTFAMMATHLADGGRLVFESRNPEFDWLPVWNGNRTLHTVDGPVNEQIIYRGFKDQIMEFDMNYKIQSDSFVSHSKIRFMPRSDIVGKLSEVGLAVESIYGDWQQQAFDRYKSKEMIFMAKRKNE